MPTHISNHKNKKTYENKTFIHAVPCRMGMGHGAGRHGRGRYIEVTGTSEVEIVPDEIHYIIEIKEYFAEEFDGKSKEEDYRTKVLGPD